MKRAAHNRTSPAEAQSPRCGSTLGANNQAKPIAASSVTSDSASVMNPRQTPINIESRASNKIA